jgi:citronellol/citronellal dehydrogenase
VRAAVAATVDAFGGIDILVNNASAISLTGTLATPMKRFDLMFDVDVRGTFLCSQACLPHLQRAAGAGRNPHILTLSPPLNMSARWFRDHVAYTMAKYGMSMCVLGMAEEFRAEGIAVNALWPRSVIATAAVAMIPGASALTARMRTPDIMADAAHAVLTRDARTTTGHFFLDEDVLASAGITDFTRYAVQPGAPLLPDLFLD